MDIVTEITGLLAVGADEEARVVESVPGQRFQVSLVVEVGVEHRAIVLGRGDEHSRFAAKEEVVRVLGVQVEGRRSLAVDGEEVERQTEKHNQGYGHGASSALVDARLGLSVTGPEVMVAIGPAQPSNASPDRAILPRRTRGHNMQKVPIPALLVTVGRAQSESPNPLRLGL